MKRSLKREERRKQNNQGFSLVELIVVIAIMAVLVAVIAPQFTQYIDRSRQSVDAVTVAGIVTAAQVGVADVIEYPAIMDGTYVVKVAKTGTTVEAGEGSGVVSVAVDDLKRAIIAACGELDTLKITAKAWDSITITIKVAGNVAIEYSNEGGSSNHAFADYIGGN